MPYKSKIRFILFVVLLTLSFHSITQPYYFRHYQVEDGLSNSTVHTCLQDKKGFIWLGTKDGLNRFNGYAFKIFRNNPGDSLSIGSNFIRILFTDHNGTLYVGTNKGLYRYNDTAENFTAINAANAGVRDIKMDNKGNLWYVLDLTLYKYNVKSKKQQQYNRSTFFEASSICTTSDGDVWISTSNGKLEKYDAERNAFTTFDVFSKSVAKTSKWIEKIYTDDQHYIFIGTSNNGVKLFDTKTNDYKDILTKNTDKTRIFARDFIQNTAEEYWIATESGIFVYNIKNGSYVNLKKNYNDPYAISDNAVYTIFKDVEGGIWAGTYFGGVNHYSKKNAAFKKYFPVNGENSISGNAVREICQDQYGRLWIGTEDAGLNKLDPKTDIFTNYKPTGAKTDINYYNIHGLATSGNKLWIGSFEHGIDLMDIQTGKVARHYDAQTGNSGLLHNFVISICKTHSGEMLIGTVSGLQRYDSLQDKFVMFPDMPKSFVYNILEDSRQTIWVATIGDGVYYFNNKTNEKGNIRHETGNKNSLSSDAVNSVFEDSYHNIWMATEGGGLCRYNVAQKRITKVFNTKNGFPSNYVFKILEDSSKNLWVTTSKGLVKLNPATGNLQVFTKANGLLSDQFNYNSAFKANDGKMYFGCLKGIISFNPNDFARSDYHAPLLITGFQVNNTELNINEKGSSLAKSVIYTKKIILQHNESSFSIDFASLSFAAPEMSVYKYKMEGLDKEWIFLKTNRKVYFTNLHPGKYIFSVKAANIDNIWNDKETILEIEILPPFWAGTPAFILYTFLAIGLICYLFSSYHRKINEKNRRKMEIFENEKQRQIYQAKIDFFTNIAHEIRTPLTLIKAPLERIVKKAGDYLDIGSNIKIMERNTNRLVQLTDQLLDFRRVETNKLRLNFEKANITEILTERFVSFKSVAEHENKKFELNTSGQQLYAYVDIDAFTTILNNLFTNAVKYCYHKVYVCLLPVGKNDAHFTFQLKNDGFLIPAEMKEKIFEPFYRINETKKQTGSGIGLALSRSLTELHNGKLYLEEPDNEMNTFTLTLPVCRPVNADIN